MIIRNLSELPPLLKKNECLLGIDYGTKLIGVAISDPNLRVASPLTTITRQKFPRDAAQLLEIMTARSIGGIVFGLPKNLQGGEGPMAQAVRAFVRNLSKHEKLQDGALPVAFWDERFSTAAVERFMIEDNMSRKRREQVIDKVAASYILQGALDALHSQLIP